jgi:four helix bundle protein
MRSNFENLRVYQLAERLADEVWALTASWNTFANDTVGKQIVRAADSVGANIAEGTGRGSFQDNRRFVRNARGSLYETQHWLRQAYRRKLLTASQVNTIKPLIEELLPRLNAYLRSIGRIPEPDSSADREAAGNERQRVADGGQRTADSRPLNSDN